MFMHAGWSCQKQKLRVIDFIVLAVLYLILIYFQFKFEYNLQYTIYVKRGILIILVSLIFNIFLCALSLILFRLAFLKYQINHTRFGYSSIRTYYFVIFSVLIIFSILSFSNTRWKNYEPSDEHIYTAENIVYQIFGELNENGAKIPKEQIALVSFGTKKITLSTENNLDIEFEQTRITHKINELIEDYNQVQSNKTGIQEFDIYILKSYRSKIDKTPIIRVKTGFCTYKKKYCSDITYTFDFVKANNKYYLIRLERSGDEPIRQLDQLASIETNKVEKWTDENGNVFLQKGDETYLLPAKYEKTGKKYKIFIFNKTLNQIFISDKLNIPPNNFIVFNLSDTDTLNLNNGVKFMFGDTFGLEQEDLNHQVSAIVEDFFLGHEITDDIDWAFAIYPEGQGDKLK